MKYKSFKEYLLANNLTDKLNDEEMAQLKSEWRKAYQKSYHKVYGEKRIRKTITLSPNEDREFEKAAKQHKMKSGEFMKHATQAYLDKTYVVPDEEQIYEIIMQLRKIGTNINQVAKYVNTRQVIMGKELDIIYELLSKLENTLEENFRKPPLFTDKLEKLLEEEPLYINKLEKILRKYQANTNKE